ncbi:MAG: AMP-binding protein [Vicingaceae bacterium]|nr:AMP-binding protein [Vicingaceae bacterium]
MFFETINKHITPNNSDIAIYDSELNSYTYTQLYDEINQIEKLYKTQNIQKGNLVILNFDKSFVGLAHLLCCLKMGVIYIPIDNNTPKNRLDKIIASSKANAIINNDFSIRFLNSAPNYMDNEACCVLYTSGSSGTPKGVVTSKKGLASFINWSSKEFKITPKDILTNYAPFHFDLSTFDVFAGLKNGASTWLIDNKLSSNFRLLGEHIKELNPTVWYATPTVYNLIKQYGNLNQINQPRLALFAGEVYNTKELNSLRNIWNNTTFYNLYGPTETNVCTYYKLPKKIEDRTTNYPIGIACPYSKILVTNSDELLISGETLMLSYLNEPSLTKEKIITTNGKKWFKSGDIVELKNDLIYYKARNDRMIKKNGYRIELFEIENELSNHPDINQVACIFKNNKIIAFYSGNKCSNITLKIYSNNQLIKYMIPDDFFHLTELPVNSNGKIDYAQLIQYL